MIDTNNFNHSNLTLGNIFKVNENVKIKNFKDKIVKDGLTVVVINNKGKIIYRHAGPLLYSSFKDEVLPLLKSKKNE